MSQHDVTAQVRVIVFVNGLWHWHFLAEHVVEIGHVRVFAGAGAVGFSQCFRSCGKQQYSD